MIKTASFSCQQHKDWFGLSFILTSIFLNYICCTPIVHAHTAEPSVQLTARNDQETHTGDYRQRKARIISHFATHSPYGFPKKVGWYARTGIYNAMAKYAVGDIQGANDLADLIFSQNLQTLGDNRSFVVMGGVDLYLRYRKYMPSELRWKIRQFITQQPALSNKSTANHRLMFFAGQYLASQAWPDWERANQVQQQTKAYISQFVVDLGQHGMIEHDSPVYHVFYLNSLLSLQDHVTDPKFRSQAQIGLELLLASMAPEWLNGYWATSTLRTFAFAHDPHQSAHIGPLGWLYWGGRKPPFWLGAAVMHAVSDYQVPEVLVDISRNRAQPYIHKETHGANFNGVAKYRKYTYMDRQYAMFSQYDGLGKLAWHKQMQRMGVVWDAPAAGASLVIKQPVHRVRGDKKTGQVLQHKRTLIGVYKGPVTSFIPRNSTVIHRFEDSGWIFIHGSTVLIGFKVINGHQGQKKHTVGYGRRYRASFDRLVSKAARNGVIIQTAPAQDFKQSSTLATLQKFAATVKSKTALDSSGINQSNPQLKFTDLDGNKLELKFNHDRKVNNKTVDYLNWPLFDNPWMTSDQQFCLRIQYGHRIRQYNCNNWTIQERSS